tara:strand:- start:132 stop:797 length:666 start_codon:yes stop_codon:yes gene_type:complete
MASSKKHKNPDQRELVDFVKDLLKIQSDADVAGEIGLSPSSLNQRKKRGTLKQFQFKKLLSEKGHDVSILNKFFTLGELNTPPASQAQSCGFRSVPEYSLQEFSGKGEFENSQSIDRYLKLPSDWLPEHDKICAVRVVGDSMYPSIGNGDSVVVEFQSACTSDGLYLVRIDNSLSIKRLQKEFGLIRIISDNNIYREMNVKLNDNNDFNIIGRCCLIIKKT